ncbi:DUF2635 domain-containing protein [Beijerinckia sp. L45]|uniref:DUF2635 domain-containing protein n=1 Tax=Beijerinckia sp. L45 TaxID=1641855 RepID=UPI00131E1EC8|nr:DUF2635 domain-containing protein [Beijerinckia sp. L45]
MSEQPARKFVKPAHAGACIPDPAHRGLDLPQAGTDVVWDHYWIQRERRGEIIVVEPEASNQASPAA